MYINTPAVMLRWTERILPWR